MYCGNNNGSWLGIILIAVVIVALIHNAGYGFGDCGNNNGCLGSVSGNNGCGCGNDCGCGCGCG